MANPHRARKRFGQNFLHDANVIERIARAIAAKPEQHLVEIGPGQGALTRALLASDCRLDAIELDRDLIPQLNEQFGSLSQFKLHQGDALNFNFASLCGESLLRVVGNLPYNISTPLIFHLLEQRQHIADMHFMLQWEVVERLAASPGSKSYGRLSVMTQYYCQVQALFTVPPGAFTPQPKVQSAIVRLVPHRELPLVADSPEVLAQVLREAFNQRRKTLRNSLKNVIDQAQLAAIGIDPGARPETLSVGQFVTISNAVAGQLPEN